ncbi:DNA helicase [Agrobacterium rubi]|uniref:DNA helicase n=1 Tax=Agrobacterium rubi TaxID=28099 RepID=A0AAE7R7V5_9HYPH|nr:DNA helicase [Agrobacterium rubi]NTE86260.1 DNA helicase [Agrobacterium rubi]NTF02192.1 DNA helicase [Agrobacterium rubi]NTF36436.1 DNA helicase [Agrobacterium rubi]OCJ44304.1 DNA helicase [Agrobacterium rubi]QTF98908.1 DNA helicase [Agrobacterium rubi]
MTLSAPIFQLKRRAKLMARDKNMPLHEALDSVAASEGFASWSLLSSHSAAPQEAEKTLHLLSDGDMLLVAGRPGQGKTRHALRLLVDALQDKRRAILFTLEFTEQQARQHIRTISKGNPEVADTLQIITSDAISADYIIQHLSGVERGSIVVIDFLQILDQNRSKPPLSEQVFVLSEFARRTGAILVFISQIDRSFDPDAKRLPDIGDIRLPNDIDLRLFTKTCFLHGKDMDFKKVA